jgi:hypothetical protein
VKWPTMSWGFKLQPRCVGGKGRLKIHITADTGDVRTGDGSKTYGPIGGCGGAGMGGLAASRGFADGLEYVVAFATRCPRMWLTEPEHRNRDTFTFFLPEAARS